MGDGGGGDGGSAVMGGEKVLVWGVEGLMGLLQGPWGYLRALGRPPI